MTQAQSDARETAQAHWPKPGHLAAVAVGGVVGSLLIGVAVHSGPTAFDTWLHHLVVVHRGDHHTLARTLTQAGSTRIIWPVVAVASLLFPRSRGWRRVATTLAFGGAAALAIGVRLGMSNVLSRPRPPVLDWATTAGGFAYPSGHTSAATIGAGALGWALVRHLDRRWARVIVWGAVVLYAGTVGWTRIWLGVHWPLDVVGAWLFGTGWMSGMAAAALLVERRFPLSDAGEGAASGSAAGSGSARTQAG
jgi:membrane-associated phospholipid phosphatase